MELQTCCSVRCIRSVAAKGLAAARTVPGYSDLWGFGKIPQNQGHSMLKNAGFFRVGFQANDQKTG